jgi:large subunit ribosomal protein L19e
MNLAKKKMLASKVLKVGKNRIRFNSDNLNDIKEAITKQDIKDLYAEGIIQIKQIIGRRKIEKRKTRRGPGKIKRTVNKRKRTYVRITRKLRLYVKELKRLEKISPEMYTDLRKRIRMRMFKSKAHLREFLEAKNKTENIVKQTKKKSKDLRGTKKDKKVKENKKND